MKISEFYTGFNKEAPHKKTQNELLQPVRAPTPIIEISPPPHKNPPLETPNLRVQIQPASALKSQQVQIAAILVAILTVFPDPRVLAFLNRHRVNGVGRGGGVKQFLTRF